MRLWLLLWLLLPLSLGAQSHLEVRMLDVGQGDAVLLRHRGRAILYDAGPNGSGVATRLGELGVDTLALVIASHPHADHIGGMANVFDSMAVQAFAWSGVSHGTATFRRLAEAVSAEDDLSWAVVDSVGGMALDWMWPPPDSSSWSLNDRSVGLRICVVDGCVMLAGDAEHAAWERWLAEGEVGPARVHKSSHHGSANGDTGQALAEIGPELVIIGVGRENRFDHPRREALELYESVGARVLRTDLHGELIVELAPDGTLRTWTEHPEVIRVHAPPFPRWPWGLP